MLNFGEHNLFFEEGQFTCEATCLQYRKYLQFALNQHCRLFYIRRQRPPSLKQSFEQLYEDDVMNIYDEVEHPNRQEEERAFHEEVVVNLCLIEIRQQGHAARKSIATK